MPQQHNPSGQDWSTVNVGASSGGLKKAAPKTARELSLAKAAGLVATEKRHGAGGNKSAHSGDGATIMSARKLEEADDVGTIAKVDKSLSKAIMQVSELVRVPTILFNIHTSSAQSISFPTCNAIRPVRRRKCHKRISPQLLMKSLK